MAIPSALDFSYSIPQANRKVNTFFKKSFRQIAQIRETDQTKVYAICLLTFCAARGIMEIRLAACVGEPLKKKERGRGFPPTSMDYQLIFHHFHPSFLSCACGLIGGLTTNPRLSRAFCKVS